MPRRRERVLGFDRMTGIEIADLADRLMEVWPENGSDSDGAAQAHEWIDALERASDRLERTVLDLRAELARVEHSGGDDVSGRPVTGS